MKSDELHNGFTLIEMIVGLVIFSVVSLGLATFIEETYRRLGLESRAITAGQELRNAIGLLSSEIKGSASVSPYFAGNDPALVSCNAALAVTANSVKFLVAEDDGTNGNGLQVYYVGYIYDSSTKELRRGEVVSGSTTSCVVPGTDPLSSSSVIASDIEQVDNDGNGVPDAVFSLNGSAVRVNLGINVKALDDAVIAQNLSTDILVRGSL